MDFIEGLPEYHGVDTVLVGVDRLTKYAHFLGYMGPTSIVSDRDKVFLSLFWRELFKLQGTSLKSSTAYHPQTDGQTEVVNKSLETYLRCFITASQDLGQLGFPAEFWYNTSFHVSSGCTPFKALYGRKPLISSNSRKVAPQFLQWKRCFKKVMPSSMI